LHRNCLLKRVIEAKIQGGYKWQEDEEEDVESYWMTLRKGEDTLIWKKKSLVCTMWRARFGSVFGPVVRQTTEWINSVFSKLLGQICLDN
jgi:hypothetical protein